MLLKRFLFIMILFSLHIFATDMNNTQEWNISITNDTNEEQEIKIYIRNFPESFHYRSYLSSAEHFLTLRLAPDEESTIQKELLGNQDYEFIFAIRGWVYESYITRISYLGDADITVSQILEKKEFSPYVPYLNQ